MQRLQPLITLTAPNGVTQYSCYWRGDDISGAKAVPQFRYPLYDGVKVQDLGADGLSWPLTLTFEGDNNDLTAMAFAKDFLAQRGNWAVQHPVYGTHNLQGITVKILAHPVDSGNITQVETTWIEPADDSIGTSVGELGAQIVAQAETANASAQAELAQINTAATNISQTVFSGLQQGLNFLGLSTLQSIVATASLVQGAISQTYQQLVAAIAAPGLALDTLAQLFQTIVQAPAAVAATETALVAGYTQFIGDIVDSITGLITPSGIAATQTNEMILGAAVTGACLAVANNAPATREEAVTAINNISSLWQDVLSALDAVQNASAANDITQSYVTFSTTYTDLAQLVGLTLQYLLSVIFDLKVAYTFTLDRPRVPFEIACTEYGSEYDAAGNSYVDLFIASNHLTGESVMLLYPGTQVTIYSVAG
jgi:hypothetical protein